MVRIVEMTNIRDGNRPFSLCGNRIDTGLELVSLNPLHETRITSF